MKISTIKNVIIFISIITLALTFPLQVLLNSPYPALIPYFFLGVLYLLPSRLDKHFLSVDKTSIADHLLIVYTLILLSHTLIQILIGFVSISEAVGLIYIYGMPLLYYYYYSRKATLKEVNSSIYAITFSGLLSGFYFAYDNFTRFVYLKVPLFSQKAHEYTLLRNVEENYKSFRAMHWVRSMGLLESHTVSGAWILLAFIAFLSILSNKKLVLRSLLSIYIGINLIIGLNFTSIFCFGILVLFIEYNLINIIDLKLSKKVISLPFLVLIMITTISSLNSKLLEIMFRYLSSHIGLLSTGSSSGKTYIDILTNYWDEYLHAIHKYPLMLVTGDGFSSYAMPKGGDIGFLETMAKFGIPFFVVTVYFLIRIIINCLKSKKIYFLNNSLTSSQPNYYTFCSGTIIIALTFDLHYSVWVAKSFLPILLFSIALFQRIKISNNAIKNLQIN